VEVAVTVAVIYVGLHLELLEQPAAVAIRSFHPGLPVTLSVSYAAIASPSRPLVPEAGQPAAWTALSRDWASCFAEDRARMRQYLNMAGLERS
jgi:8-oxo-dGTP diphosphatase